VSELSQPDFDGLPAEQLRRLHRDCREFEAAWQAGKPPRVEDYLAGWSGPGRLALLRELIPLDVYYRRRRGEQPAPEDYGERFPALDAAWLTHALTAERDGPSPFAAPMRRPPDGTRTTVGDPQATGPYHDLEPPGTEMLSVQRPTALPQVPGYEVLGELGRGGMGVVYQALQPGLKRLVALKMIRDAALAGPEDSARFKAEAQAVARLQHPHIVQIHEVGEHEGLPYFSLEFCAGGSLADRLRGTPLPPREAAQLVEVLAQAIHAAHQAHIVHRDLKPANILLQRKSEFPTSNAEGAGSEFTFRLAEYEPKVTDFGLAKRLDEASLTASGVVMGTASYMAPEQANGKTKSVGPAADVYALGAILYECLTGRPPFRAATALDTILQVVADDPVPVRQLQPRTARDLETICLQCLVKDPTKRYPSAADLAEDLRRFREGEPIRARPAGRAERLVKWARRRPLVAALSAVTLAGIAGVAVALGMALDERDRADLLRRRAEKGEAEKGALLDQARNLLLTAQLVRVGSVLEHDPHLARRLLHDREACPIHLRDAAWHYFDRQCAAWTKAVLLGHTGSVTAVAFSRDGRLLVTAGQDQSVRLWDPATGKGLAVWEGLGGPLALSPDGKTVAAGLGKGGGKEPAAVQLLDTAGKRQRVLRAHPAGVTALAFSPKGDALASAGKDGAVKLWSLEDGSSRAIQLPTGEPTTALAFRPDGAVLAWDAKGVVQRWEVGPGRASQPLAVPVQNALAGSSRASFGPGGQSLLAFSPSGQDLAAVSGNSVVLVDAATGKARTELKGHLGGINEIAFSPDGRTLASAGFQLSLLEDGRGEVRLWDLARGEQRTILKGHPGAVRCLAYTPDGTTLATGGDTGEVRLWDLGPQRGRRVLQGGVAGPSRLAFLPDCRRLAWVAEQTTDGQGGLALWDPSTGRARVLGGMAYPVSGIAFSPDGKYLVAAEETKGQPGPVHLWDVAAGKELAPFQGEAQESYWAFAFSPDGKLVAGGGVKGAVTLWEAATRRRVHSFAMEETIASLAFSPDGKLLAATQALRDNPAEGGGDRNVLPALSVYDLRTGKVRLAVKDLPKEAIPFAAFHPDSNLLAVTVRNAVKILAVADGAEVATLRGHAGPIASVAFSPDGKSLVSVGGMEVDWPGEVKLWDLGTAQERATLAGPAEVVYAAAFRPDGQCLAVGGPGHVYLWDLSPDPKETAFRMPEEPG
jgi:WD40 repeat protein